MKKFLLLLFLPALLVACGRQGAAQPADEVAVQLNWLHYGAFGGFYAADQNGDYAAESLTAAFRQGGPEIDPTTIAAAGEAQFGVTSADTLLLARAEGKPDAIGPMVTAYDADADPALESAKMDASVPLIHTGQDQIGWMRPDRWQEMGDALLQQDVLSAPLDLDEVYTMEFLHTIYGEEQ